MEIGEGLGRPIPDRIRILTFSEQAIKLLTVAWERASQYRPSPSRSSSPEGRRTADHLRRLAGCVGCWAGCLASAGNRSLYYQDVFIDGVRGACGAVEELWEMDVTTSRYHRFRTLSVIKSMQCGFYSTTMNRWKRRAQKKKKHNGCLKRRIRRGGREKRRETCFPVSCFPRLVGWQLMSIRMLNLDTPLFCP